MWTDTLTRYQEMIETSLRQYMPEASPDDPAGKVTEAMRYSLLCGGKRIRPVLTLAFCELCGGDPELALPFACAVEMVHTYSLIHDDMPCMDNDDMRRGKPTNHKVYGEDMALLAGDGLLTKAFETALSAEEKETAANAALVLARCAGEKGMVGGQCIDLRTEGKEADLSLLVTMDMGKTVALISAACRMGCIAAHSGKTMEKAAEQYATGLGMAFQIRDDILDVQGDPQKLGKNVGMDAAMNKRNYVSLLGVEEAQKLVQDYTERALESLKTFPGDTDFLQRLAKSLVKREA
ncbi:MAG: polyprenyl synthetase family protein [Acutalibacter sp.]|nr:polyprenyl synthetase family protein [Acutalibacter sp.]